MQYIILSLSIINLLLGVIILIHSNHEKDNIIFLFFTLCVSFWTFNNFYLRINPSLASLRVSYGLGIIVALYYLIWIYFFLKKNLPLFIKILLIPLSFILFLVTLFTDLIIKDFYSIQPLGYEGQLGQFFYAYSLYLSLIIILAIYNLVRGRKEIEDKAKISQISNILYGVIFFACVSFTVSFLIPTIFHTLRFTVLDNLSFSVLLGCIVYAILKNQLFNVKVIVTEGFLFVLWVTLFIRAITSTSIHDIIINVIILILTIIVGIFLIKSVLREVEQRERIEKLAKDLEISNKQLGKANTDLATANSRLKELDDLKNQFLSFATHQIRAPLTAIKGYASLILEGDFGDIADPVKGAVETIFKSCGNLVVIVNEFLDVSRIEQGRMKYDMTDFDLKKLCEDSLNELRPNIEKAGLSSNFSADDKDFSIVGDQGKIKQVIGNVIDNAIKYTPHGSIAIKLSRAADVIRIAISDTGIGIDKDEIPKLFEKFSRAKDASKQNVIGTGLGLYVAKQMIEAHKGKVWVESQGKGKGSTFVIELPVKK